MGGGDEDMGADAARAHGDFLRDLGFPESVVESAVEARRAGLLEPDPALVEGTARAVREIAEERARVARAYVDELRSLGFPEMVIEEAARAREAGLFRTDPPADLSDRIMEAVARAAGWPRRRGDGG